MALRAMTSSPHFTYAGDISVREAWNILASDPRAELIDVRTVPEWSFVGTPDLRSLGKEVVTCSWRVYPMMQINQNFVSQLIKSFSEKDTPLLFICRSGGRSLDAAITMSEAGYTSCYNILEGFEGELSQESRRGVTGGWKSARLPWRQS